MIRTTGMIGAALIALALSPVATAVEIFALHTDHAGSVIMETDKDRNVTWQGQYEPYGLPRQAAPEGPGFTGHVHDQASGLVYMQQRYYDPEVGRFLSVDPVGVNDAEGTNFNRYWYANTNPYLYRDPDGRQGCSDMAAQGLSGKCVDSKNLSEANKFDTDAVGKSDAFVRNFAGNSDQRTGNETIQRIDNQADGKTVGSDFEVTKATPNGVEFEFSEVAGAAGVVHTHPTDANTIVPGASDWQLPSKGIPNYVVHGTRSVVVEISGGQVRVRVVRGKLERSDIRGIEDRVDEMQEHGSR